MKQITRQLDAIRRLEEAFEGGHEKLPTEGWLAATRVALRFSRATIAKRLGITESALRRIEKLEIRGTLTIQEFRRIAEALDCDFDLKLVPKRGRSFGELAADHSFEVQMLKATEHSMALEGQGTMTAKELRNLRPTK